MGRGAVLFEELDGVRNPCGYKSGAFINAKQNYHSTFKEILAMERAIKKFQFHLIGHHFTVEMDMSSFPRMLHFQKKLLPHLILNYSDGHNGFLDGIFKQRTLTEPPTFLRIISLANHSSPSCQFPWSNPLSQFMIFPLKSEP